MTNVPVLIVDDNAAKRLAMKSVLSPLGYTVVEADSGVAALRCVMAQDFAVILLDVCMPITDGFETAALIRRRRESEWTPIIFITGYANDELTTTDHYAEGAVDFIFAPVPPDELRSKVAVFAKLFLRAETARGAGARRAGVRRPAANPHRSRADRHLPDRRRQPVRVHEPALDRDLRRDRGGSRRPEVRIGARDDNSREPARVPANPELVRRRAQPASRDPRTGTAAGYADRRIVTSAAIRDTDGDTIGWVGTVADVTAEAGAEAAMAAARDAAVAANVMQKNFAASASHELRTPTTSILGYTEEVLESETLSKQDREFLEIVYRNAQRLGHLIDDLLILDQAEIGPAMMHIETTELAPLVDEVIETFSAAVQRADITLVAEHGADTPLARVDPQRFEQALTNLIGNAVKFTPDGGDHQRRDPTSR